MDKFICEVDDECNECKKDENEQPLFPEEWICHRSADWISG